MGKRADHAQQELALSSALSHAIFAGRSTLYLSEVASAWRCTTRHVGDLIMEGKLAAFDIAGTPITKGGANMPDRRYWRVPVSAFDQFVRQNQSL